MPIKRKRTKPESYRDEAFHLLMSRFDRVDKDNQEIKNSVDQHIQKEFGPLKSKVQTHSTYWGLLTWLGGTLILSLVAWFQGLFKN